jgi:protein-tyrosine phosphatase
MKTKLNIKIPKNNIQDDKLQNINNIKNDCHHIINEIYLSGYKSANDYNYLKTNKFTHIINCATASKNFTPILYEDFTYLTLDINDEPGFDIIYYIYQCIDFIENADNVNNRKILIHCYEGVSRAPTLLSSYLVWKYNYEIDFVISLIKEKRKCVDINLGFLFQLDKWHDDRKRKERVIRVQKCGNISLSDMWEGTVTRPDEHQIQKLHNFISLLKIYENEISDISVSVE